jgi:hypothetical protein
VAHGLCDLIERTADTLPLFSDKSWEWVEGHVLMTGLALGKEQHLVGVTTHALPLGSVAWLDYNAYSDLVGINRRGVRLIHQVLEFFIHRYHYFLYVVVSLIIFVLNFHIF